MQHFSLTKNFGHGDHTGRRSDSSMVSASSLSSRDQHPQSAGFANNGAISGMLEMHPANDAYRWDIVNAASVWLSQETSTNRSVSSVPISPSVPTSYLYTFGDRAGAISTLTERPSAYTMKDVRQVYGHTPSRLELDIHTPDKKYRYVSDPDPNSENRKPLNGTLTQPEDKVDTHGSSGKFGGFNVPYELSNAAFRPGSENDNVGIWSPMPTTFPCVLVSTSIKSENVEGHAKTCYRLQERTRNSYNVELGSPGKSGRVLYNCVDRSLSPNPVLPLDYKGDSSSSTILGETAKKVVDRFNLQTAASTRNETNCSKKNQATDARKNILAQETPSEVGPMALPENKSSVHSIEDIARSGTVGNEITLSNASSGTTTLSARNGGVRVSVSNRNKVRNKQIFQSEDEFGTSKEHVWGKNQSVAKYNHCKNGSPVVDGLNSPNIANTAHISLKKAYASSRKSLAFKNRGSGVYNQPFKWNHPEKRTYGRDKHYHALKTKLQNTAVDSKVSADGTSRHPLPALSNRKTKRKLNIPQRSAAHADPYFRGATVWLQTIYKDGQSSLQISAFYSNVKVRTPRARRGYSRVRGLIPEAYSCSETEDCSPQYGRLHSLCGLAKTCASCRTRRTPLWRDAEDGTPLCNACGIRYKKYRLRCSKCWNIPKKDIKTYPNCPVCGGALRYSFQRKTW